MKVRRQTGRGKSKRVEDRPVRVHQHGNSWAQVEYLDGGAGPSIVTVTALVMENEADLGVFHPALGNHGRLWDEHKLVPCDDGTFVFVRRPAEEIQRLDEFRRGGPRP